MRKQLRMKFMLLLFALVAGIGNAWADDPVTISASDQGLSNGETFTTINSTHFSLTFAQNNSTNPVKYYSSSFRFYKISSGGSKGASVTVAASEGYLVTAVTLTGGGSNFTASTGSYSNENWTGSANSVELSHTSTSGSTDVSSIVVTVTATGGNPTYTLTITDPTGGTITVLDSEANEVSSGDKFEAGVELTIEAAASTGYTFTEWTGTTSAYASTSSASTTFTMPATAATIAATFTPNTHSLSLTSSNGTCVTTINGVTWDGSSSIPYGAAVVVTATPNTGYQFSSWTCSYNTVTENDNEISFTMPDADVTLTANYAAIPTYTAQFSVNGNIDNANNCTVAQGAAITFPSNPSDISGNKFVGWTTATISGTTNTTPTPLVTSATMGNSNIIYYAVFATLSESTVTDELTTSTFGSPSNYTDWSGKQATSSAVYAGNSTTYNNSAIQIRSTNSSGIITTTSGGKATKVTVSWNDGTADDRTLDVYGKSTAYSAASNLYDNSYQGTKLGSLYHNVEINNVKTTTTELTIDGNYPYIGLRSKSNAMYLDEIDIQWEVIAYSNYCTSVYAIAAQSNNNSYGTVALNGSIITATPTSGYTYASPAYTVSSGSATVVQNGNKFTVTPSSNCTITINFQAIPTHTATFSVNGNTSQSVTVAEGADINFPEVTDISVMKFVGWTTSAIAGTQTSAPATLVSEATMGNSNITYYAVFVEELSASFDASDITNTPSSGTREWTHTASGMSIYLSDGQYYTGGTPYTFTVNSGTTKYLQISSIANYNLTEVVVTISGADYKINSVESGASVSTSSTTQTITFSSNMTSVKCYATSSKQIRAKTISVKARGTYCTSVYSFTTAGNWNESAKWAPSGAPASTNFVYINAACTIPNEVIASAQKIILGNNGSITIADGGQLITNNAVNATVQKNITKWDEGSTGGWYFIASPITGSISPASVTNLLGEQIQTTPSVLYNYDLYRFNPSEPDNKGWENYHQHNENEDPFLLVNGQGYLYAKSSTTTLDFAGAIKPYDANNTIPVVEGWNLIGNPYTFNAYPNHAYYTINDANTGITANTETSNAAVAPCTGIIVKATSEGTVKFLENGPAASANHGNLQMVLSQTVATRGESNTVTLDNAIVSFNEGSELPKFYFGNQDANIYIPQNNEQYAIVSSEARGEMLVCFKANRDGQFTINVNAENVEMSYLHLIDNIAGQDIDLLNTPSYTFDAKGDDYESRFRLVFSASQNENDNQNEDFAFISNGEIIVNGTGTIQIIDMMGRVVSTRSTEERISTNGMTAGVYVLQLVNGTDVKTQKVVIR